MNEKPKRRKFTDEFKKNAVTLVIDQKHSCSEVARRLNVNHTNVSRWVRESRDQADAPAPSNTQRDLEAENRRLQKENQRLLMERDILKRRRPSLRTSRSKIRLHPAANEGLPCHHPV